MLCFLFAALIVALDQFFKHWVLRTLEIGEVGPEIVPGILGLTLWENDGAMLNILSGQQWLLAAIAFIAAVVLVMILLRYNEGFWGTLGLAAVLGGTLGNLADRVFNDGKVVDMFKTLFINFPIFNIADIFITLGFITFLIHFIALTIKGEAHEQTSGRASGRYAEDDYDGEYDDDDYDDEYAESTDDSSMYDEYDVPASPPQTAAPRAAQAQPQYEPMPLAADEDYGAAGYASDDYSSSDFKVPLSSDYDTSADITADMTADDIVADSSFTLDDLDAELESIDDYDVDDLLREYGFDDSDDI